MWGGRFNEPTDAFVEAFTASVSFDQRMALVDIEGSLAHAKTLHKIEVLDDSELAAIEDGMAQIREEIEEGSFEWSVSLEDVHIPGARATTRWLPISGSICAPRLTGY